MGHQRGQLHDERILRQRDVDRRQDPVRPLLVEFVWGSIEVGGMLDWSATSGHLQEIAMPATWAGVGIEVDNSLG
jgi:hypothetical protein